MRHESLVNKIKLQARANNVETRELYKRFGITEFEWLEFLDNMNDYPGFDNEQIRKIAAFIGIPAFAVHLHLQRLELVDFINPDTLAVQGLCTTASRLNKALAKIEVDSMIPGGLPPETYLCSDAVKALIVCLYEQATVSEVFPSLQMLGWVGDVHKAAFDNIKLVPGQAKQLPVAWAQKQRDLN